MEKLIIIFDGVTEMNEIKIERIMGQVMAHVSWLFEGDQIYNNIKKLITEKKEKRDELVKLLSEEIP